MFLDFTTTFLYTLLKSLRPHHGLPNLVRPLRVAAGESRYGDPLAFVAMPPGSRYEPGLKTK